MIRDRGFSDRALQRCPAASTSRVVKVQALEHRTIVPTGARSGLTALSGLGIGRRPWLDGSLRNNELDLPIMGITTSISVPANLARRIRRPS